MSSKRSQAAENKENSEVPSKKRKTILADHNDNLYTNNKRVKKAIISSIPVSSTPLVQNENSAFTFPTKLLQIEDESIINMFVDGSNNKIAKARSKIQNIPKKSKISINSNSNFFN